MPAPDAALGESTAPPVCRHWSRTGTCLYAERCRFLHPPDRDGVDAYDPSNKPVERSDEKGDPERGTQGRRRVRKRGKCGFLRRFMLDTFGLERLRRGVVLDVGGGNGELSFELENLNDVRCVVVDPQRIAVRKLEVKLRGGWYHRTAPLQRYNTAPPPPAVEGTREEREQRIAKQIEQTDGPSVSGPSSDAGGWRPRRPMHWRVLWSPALWMDGGGGGESGADVVALYNAWAAARVIRFRPSRGDEDPALPSSRSSPGGDGTHERDGEKITNALRTLGTFGDPRGSRGQKVGTRGGNGTRGGRVRVRGLRRPLGRRRLLRSLPPVSRRCPSRLAYVLRRRRASQRPRNGVDRRLCAEVQDPIRGGSVLRVSDFVPGEESS